VSALLSAAIAAAPSDPIKGPSVDLTAVMPVLIILGAACVAVVAEAVLPRSRRYGTQLTLSVVAIVAAGVWTIVAGIKQR
jgi:NADH-quinone oxidoreductase subunit N